MREIKFRAWDKKEKKMKNENDFLMSLDGEILDPSTFPFMVNKNCLLMQYTGLKDKNGKEIFEGDIVLISEDENKKAANTPHEDHFLFGDKAQIFFDECNANFVLLDNESGEETSIGYYAGWSNWNWLTVIGNIYENPELLDVKK